MGRKDWSPGPAQVQDSSMDLSVPHRDNRAGSSRREATLAKILSLGTCSLSSGNQTHRLVPPRCFPESCGTRSCPRTHLRRRTHQEQACRRTTPSPHLRQWVL